MYKKAVWSIVLIATVGLLTYGAVNRTLAKTSDNDTRSEPAYVAANHGQASEVPGGQGWGRIRSQMDAEEADDFKVGELTNEISDQFVQIREVSGRPLWAGRGQGRNR